jgi:hypothetical protein
MSGHLALARFRFVYAEASHVHEERLANRQRFYRLITSKGSYTRTKSISDTARTGPCYLI